MANKSDLVAQRRKSLLAKARIAHERGDAPLVVEIFRHWPSDLERRAEEWAMEGIAWLNLQNHNNALRCLSKATELGDNSSITHYHLAKAAYLSEKLEVASVSLEHLARIEPDRQEHARNWINVLRRLERHEDASAICRQSIERFPDAIEFQELAGEVAMSLSRWSEAADVYEGILRANPSQSEFRSKYISALRRLGDRERVSAALSEWCRFEPENEIPRHLLSAYGNEQETKRASDGYVRDVFNQFAATFDDHLAKLEYRVPALMANLIATEGTNTNKQLHLCDAGCGTGLLGPALRPACERLVGVDLSDKMLEHANEKGSYDELHCQELTLFLGEHRASFDWIVSADTLNYFGSLLDVLTAAFNALKPALVVDDATSPSQSLLWFTLESHALIEGTEPPDYELQTTGRYSHSQRYVRGLLEQIGFGSITCSSEVLRMEAGQPVNGLVWIARR